MRCFSAAVFAAAMAPQAWAADFSKETWCEGQIYFSNEDGTASLYDLTLWSSDGRYVLVSHDLETGNVLEDRGECDLSKGEACRHYIQDDGESDDSVTPQDAYAFVLSPFEGERYMYREIWLDGSQGRGLLTCFSAMD